MSTSQQTGWGNYPDSTYTEGSPLELAANTDTVLLNDRARGDIRGSSRFRQVVGWVFVSRQR